ncbi:MAG TPA: hypothetical protein DCG37_08740 [Lachnospiraceae bacterium]|nr:hypothetical protein [Lachnospiraceae bacterium]
MAKQRPEEPKPKKTLKTSLISAKDSFIKIIKSPLENEKVKRYTDKVQSMDKNQGKKFLACLAGGFLLIIYLILVHVYSNRFIDGTYINGINVGSKTPEQVEALLQKRIESYTLTLTMRSPKAAAEYAEEVQAIGKEEPPAEEIPAEEVPAEGTETTGGMEIIAPVEFAEPENASNVQEMSTSETDETGTEETEIVESDAADTDASAAVPSDESSAAIASPSDDSISDSSLPDESLSDVAASDEAAAETVGAKQEDIGGEKTLEDLTPEEKSRESQDVAYKDVVVEKIPGKLFDYTYIPSGEVAEIQAKQNPFLWIIGKLGYKKEYTVASATEYNEEKLEKRISALSESNTEKQLAPTNAQIILKNDHTFEIIPETYGTEMNKDALIKVANKAVKSSTEEVNIVKDDDIYSQPVVIATDEGLVSQEEALNTFLDTEITYQLPNDEIRVLGKDTVSQWVSLQDNGFYYIDDAAIAQGAASYAAALAQEFDVLRDTRDFESTNAGTIQIECETYGRLIDEEQEAALITQELLTGTSETREPVYSMNNLERDPRLGGTYVEVDKPAQTVYYYENYELQMASECVTGTETSSSRYTPTGIYSIYMMERGRTLRGGQLADGSYSYASYVNYWMAFNGGIGLHDATWRDDFGGSIYWYSGSHGCVNLPYWAAQELYNMVDIGTTVIVIDY